MFWLSLTRTNPTSNIESEQGALRMICALNAAQRWSIGMTGDAFALGRQAVWDAPSAIVVLSVEALDKLFLVRDNSCIAAIVVTAIMICTISL